MMFTSPFRLLTSLSFLAGSALAQEVSVPPPTSQQSPATGGVADQTANTIEPKALAIEKGENDESGNGVANPAESPSGEHPAENPASTDAGEVEGETTADSESPGSGETEGEQKAALPEVAPEEPAGIQIHIEKINGKPVPAGSSSGSVQVSSPWPAKPLNAAPPGWRFVPAPASIPPYRTEVKLDDSHTVNLAITPYLLVPASDGRNVMTIKEPGYDRQWGYFQKETLGALLESSSREIERQEKTTAAAIERLQELLTCLPKP